MGIIMSCYDKIHIINYIWQYIVLITLCSSYICRINLYVLWCNTDGPSNICTIRDRRPKRYFDLPFKLKNYHPIMIFLSHTNLGSGSHFVNRSPFWLFVSMTIIFVSIIPYFDLKIDSNMFGTWWHLQHCSKKRKIDRVVLMSNWLRNFANILCICITV